jgi:hypothetical protein
MSQRIGLLLFLVACQTPSPPPQNVPGVSGMLDAPPDDLANGGSCPEPTGTGTSHSSNISGSETWTAATSPHFVTSSFTIDGALKLEPCVVVVMSKNVSITLNGTITARGTYDEKTEDLRPVVFTHAADGEFWGQLDVRKSGLLDLELTALAYGGSTDIVTVEATVEARGDQTLPIAKNLRFVGVVITDSAQSGVQVASHASFTDDSAVLIVTRSGQQPDVSPNFKSGFPVIIEPPGMSSLPKGGTYTGNRRDAIYVYPRVQVGTSDGLPNLGVPYIFKGGGGVTYYAMDKSPLTFTVEAGVTARFEENAYLQFGDEALRAPTTFVANGSAEKPIVFTSDAQAPAAGDWGGLRIVYSLGTGNTVNYSTIEYAGAPTQWNGFGCGNASTDGGLIIRGEFWKPDAPFVKNSTFRHLFLSGIVGAWFYDPTPGDWKSTNTFSDITSPYSGDDGYVCDVSRPGPDGPPCTPKGQCL